MTQSPQYITVCCMFICNLFVSCVFCICVKLCVDVMFGIRYFMSNVVNFSVFQYYVYMSVYQFVYSSVCLSISLFRQFVHLTFIHPQSISLSIHLFLYSIHLSVYLPYIYQSIKSVCPLVSQSIYPSVSLYSIHWYVCLHSICQSPSTQIVFHIFKI